MQLRDCSVAEHFPLCILSNFFDAEFAKQTCEGLKGASQLWAIFVRLRIWTNSDVSNLRSRIPCSNPNCNNDRLIDFLNTRTS